MTLFHRPTTGIVVFSCGNRINPVGILANFESADRYPTSQECVSQSKNTCNGRATQLPTAHPTNYDEETSFKGSGWITYTRPHRQPHEYSPPQKCSRCTPRGTLLPCPGPSCHPCEMMIYECDSPSGCVAAGCSHLATHSYVIANDSVTQL